MVSKKLLYSSLFFITLNLVGCYNSDVFVEEDVRFEKKIIDLDLMEAQEGTFSKKLAVVNTSPLFDEAKERKSFKNLKEFKSDQSVAFSQVMGRTGLGIEGKRTLHSDAMKFKGLGPLKPYDMPSFPASDYGAAQHQRDLQQIEQRQAYERQQAALISNAHR
jgi:hypothetical protein